MLRSNSKLSYAITFAVLAMLGATPLIIKALWAEENPASLQLAQAPEKKAAGDKEDPFAVPKGGVDELIQFINDVQKVEPEGNSQEAQIENSQKIASAVVIACERILAADPSDEQAQAVASVAFQALWHLVSTEDESALPKIDKLIDQLAKDERPELVALSIENSILRRIQAWDTTTKEEKEAFSKDFKKLMTSGPLTQEKLQLAMTVGQLMEQIGEPQIAASAYEALIAELPMTPQTEEIIANMKGTIRRLNLPGKFMPIEGTTLKGEKFDWASYRGKVVLVDFWATWCGPCIKELPNLLNTYEKYHDKGFDVVGISLDDESSDVKEFVTKRHIPWVTLLEKDPQKRGWNTPLANYYGISGIPATMLVDKEGKVVALSVFGEELDEKLEELLGSTK